MRHSYAKCVNCRTGKLPGWQQNPLMRDLAERDFRVTICSSAAIFAMFPPCLLKGVDRGRSARFQTAGSEMDRQYSALRPAGRQPPRRCVWSPAGRRASLQALRVSIWSHRQERTADPPRWGDEPGERAAPVVLSAAKGGAKRAEPLRWPWSGFEGVWGQSPHADAGEGRESPLFAQEGTVRGTGGPRALQTKPRVQNRSGRRLDRRYWDRGMVQPHP